MVEHYIWLAFNAPGITFDELAEALGLTGSLLLQSSRVVHAQKELMAEDARRRGEMVRDSPTSILLDSNRYVGGEEPLSAHVEWAVRTLEPLRSTLSAFTAADGHDGAVVINLESEEGGGHLVVPRHLLEEAVRCGLDVEVSVRRMDPGDLSARS